ncbi:MAG: hypothetical protein ACXVZ3_06905 [Gaiellaceae bacterium]
MPTTIRPNLLPSTTVTFPVNTATATKARGIYTTGGGAEIHIAGLPVPQGAWVIAAPPIETPSGQVVPARSHSNCLFSPRLPRLRVEHPVFERIAACLTRYHLHESVTYQPASHYWPLQLYETGIFLTLAAGLSATAYWWIQRRLT